MVSLTESPSQIASGPAGLMTGTATPELTVKVSLPMILHARLTFFARK